MIGYKIYSLWQIITISIHLEGVFICGFLQVLMRYSTHCIWLQSCQLGPRTLDCTIFWLQWVGKNVENYICLTIFRLGFVKKKDRVQVSRLINDVKWKKFCATILPYFCALMAFANNYWSSTFDTFTIFQRSSSSFNGHQDARHRPVSRQIPRPKCLQGNT